MNSKTHPKGRCHFNTGEVFYYIIKQTLYYDFFSHADDYTDVKGG